MSYSDDLSGTVHTRLSVAVLRNILSIFLTYRDLIHWSHGKKSLCVKIPLDILF